METKETQKMILSSGPLQGFTDDIFRSTHHQVWGGIDFYYGPYIRLDNHKPPKKSQLKDSLSELNKSINYIPQILANNPELIIEQAKALNKHGYQHLNWNLGCPYPMVTKRNMGAGLLPQPKIIDEILKNIISEIPMKLSIKCRLGLHKDDEIKALIEVFNKYALQEIIIHARTGKQMYKGFAQAEKVIPLLKQSHHKIVYNGDLDSVEKYNELHKLFSGHIHHFMIGRALLKKPQLASQIKGTEYVEEELQEKLFLFHELLFEKYQEKLHYSHLLMKMRSFWEYFSYSFEQQHKTFKAIKKSKTIKKYNIAVKHIFSENKLSLD